MFEVVCLECKYGFMSEEEEKSYHDAATHHSQTNHRIRIVHPK